MFIPLDKKADLRVAYSTSPGMGPIINCCLEDHLGSGVGHPDLNQYFPFPCLLVSATMEVSLTSSRLGFTGLMAFLAAELGLVLPASSKVGRETGGEALDRLRLLVWLRTPTWGAAKWTGWAGSMTEAGFLAI